jgi:hypothetical protein
MTAKDEVCTSILKLNRTPVTATSTPPAGSVGVDDVEVAQLLPAQGAGRRVRDVGEFGQEAQRQAHLGQVAGDLRRGLRRPLLDRLGVFVQRLVQQQPRQCLRVVGVVGAAPVRRSRRSAARILGRICRDDCGVAVNPRLSPRRRQVRWADALGLVLGPQLRLVANSAMGRNGGIWRMAIGGRANASSRWGGDEAPDRR